MKKVFIKIVLRVLALKYNLIYIDESKTLTISNNYHCWRKPQQEIYINQDKKLKLNLIMAVNKYEFIHYQLNKENTNANMFIEFLKEIKKNR
jgi:hypothetical protein